MKKDSFESFFVLPKDSLDFFFRKVEDLDGCLGLLMDPERF